MPELTSLFPDVADALDIESVAIVEKVILWLIF